MAHDYFTDDTVSTRVAEGLRELQLSDRWNTPLGQANGGYILAAMGRGLSYEFPSSTPVSAAISFLSPPAAGSAELSTRALKHGRTIQTAQAELHQGGRAIAHLVSNFAAGVSGTTTELGTPPALPEPDDCADLRSSMQSAGFGGGIADRMEFRVASLPDRTPSEDPTFEFWQRIGGLKEVDEIALSLMVDSFLPAVFELGETSVTVQLTAQLYRRPVPGWIATRLTTRHLVDGFHEEDCELWDESGNLVAQSRQLALLG